MKRNILALCAAALLQGSSVPWGLQYEARNELAGRGTTLKNKGPNATKGKRQASLKSRSNRRK